MPALVGPGTWVNCVNVVDAAAGGIPLDNLITHDYLVDDDRGVGRRSDVVRWKLNGVLGVARCRIDR